MRALQSKINDFFLLKKINLSLIKNKDKVCFNIEYNKLALLYTVIIYEKNSGVRGFGTSKNEQKAIIIAWSEFIERLCVSNLSEKNNISISSNGFATHDNIEQSKCNALLEIIERDSFLCSWLLRLPAKSTQFKSTNKLKELEYFSNKHNINVHFGKLPSCMGATVYVCYVFGKYFQMETNASFDQEKSQKSIIKKALSLITIESKLKNEMYIAKISKNPKPIDHKFYHLKNNKQNFLSKWLINDQKKIKTPKFQFNFKHYNNFTNFNSITKLHTTRCIAKNCQNLFFGPTTEKKVNLIRLSNILGKKITFKELNQDVHPLP